MAAKVFDIYDLNSPMVMPTAPAAPAAAAATRASARLLRASVGVLAFAGVLLVAALLVAVTPLGAIDADITVPFLVVVIGALAAMAWAVMR